ncbi:hypothetical protein EZV62_022418 [Acer yangbiense]|uniref:MULE transposase domain-containing protein n=1 Tax=Acer yangbiense TaxID=1000413 RepID=A0A5C7H922_9ROSI|nr:hypothetical protein EZV62_022418 [Acer yangbiense]
MVMLYCSCNCRWITFSKSLFLHGTNVIDLGECGGDHISLITLVHAITEQLSGSSKVPSKECSVWVQLPWCSDVVEVFTNRDLLGVFREFGVHRYDTICFQVEQACCKPCPPSQESLNQPIEEPEVVEQIGWCDEEADMFDYVASSDGEGTQSSFDEEADDNGYSKGLIKALAKHFPNASKRFCAKHIYANFRGSYCGDNFKKLFWKASRSSTVYDFKAALNDISQI